MAAKEIHPVLVTATSEADQTLLEAGSDPALLQLQPQSGKHEAPIELLGEFLRCLMSEEYDAAKFLCQKVLELEPDNCIAQEFVPVIEERLKIDKELETESSSEDEDEDSVSSDDKSSSSQDEFNETHNHCNHSNKCT